MQQQECSRVLIAAHHALQCRTVTYREICGPNTYKILDLRGILEPFLTFDPRL